MSTEEAAVDVQPVVILEYAELQGEPSEEIRKKIAQVGVSDANPWQ